MRIGFLQWIYLRENFDPTAYDRLFDGQLSKLLPRLTDPAQRGRMEGFGWTNYIAASLRNAGFREQGDLEEKIHDVVVKLLVSPGGLFANYDERRHGPLDMRFKASVGNAVRNIVEKERNRRKYLRPVSIGGEFEPGSIQADDLPGRPDGDDDTDPTLIEKFRQLLLSRHGGLVLAVFDARMEGREMKDLAGLPELGSPGRYQIKHAVQNIKEAARAFAQNQDDPAFLPGGGTTDGGRIGHGRAQEGDCTEKIGGSGGQVIVKRRFPNEHQPVSTSPMTEPESLFRQNLCFNSINCLTAI